MPSVSLSRLLVRLASIALAAAPATAVAEPAVTPCPTAQRSDAALADLDLPVDTGALATADAQAALGRSLAHALVSMRPIDATHTATTWALADDVVRRGAVAAALEWWFPLVGDDVILDHLSRDDSAAVRVACARAAWLRRATGGDPGVLSRLATDPDEQVRAIAQIASR